jgi:hypothetical protein
MAKLPFLSKLWEKVIPYGTTKTAPDTNKEQKLAPEPQDDNYLPKVELEQELKELKTIATLINRHVLELAIDKTEGQPGSVYNPKVYDTTKEQPEHEKHIQSIVDSLNNEQTSKIATTAFNTILDPYTRGIIIEKTRNKLNKMKKTIKAVVAGMGSITCLNAERLPYEEALQTFSSIESAEIRQIIIETVKDTYKEPDKMVTALEARTAAQIRTIETIAKDLQDPEKKQYALQSFKLQTIPFIGKAIIKEIKDPELQEELIRTHKKLQNKERPRLKRSTDTVGRQL